MISLFSHQRCGPIGIDIGSQAVKLLQLNADRSDVWEAARWDLPAATSQDDAARDAAVVDAIGQAREGRLFRGREAVLAIGHRDLFVQNIRVPQADGAELERLVRNESAGRLPFDAQEAELRFIETADVRQGNSVRREVIVLAAPRSAIQRYIAIAEQSGLIPVAIDVSPAALLRSIARQYRRDEDQEARMLLLNIGATGSTVVICRGAEPMFIKYLDVGGRQLDEAVARHLGLRPSEATALRRQSGDRRTDQRDPEVAQSLADACRPVLEHLANELALCMRYYSVTFRGQPLARVVLSGGEAHQTLADWLQPRVDLPCDVGNPLRSYRKTPPSGRAAQWDVATGLALREVN